VDARLDESSDRFFFLLPPSFYALVGGTLLSVVIDLIRTLVSIQTQVTQNYTQMRSLAIPAISISATSFLFLSMKLEGLRTEYAMRELLKAIKTRKHDKKHLRLALLIGFLGLGFGLIALILGYFMSLNQGVVDC
jgi:hypothetical protein